MFHKRDVKGIVMYALKTRDKKFMNFATYL